MQKRDSFVVALILCVILLFSIYFLVVSVRDSVQITPSVIFFPSEGVGQKVAQQSLQKVLQKPVQMVEKKSELFASVKKPFCSCKKLTVKLTGKVDGALFLPGEIFGVPSPVKKESLMQNLGPSVGFIVVGEHKGDLHVGWNFEILADIDGVVDGCEENQQVKSTIEYAGVNGVVQVLKAHNAGFGQPDLLSERGNAGYGSKIWAPDYVAGVVDYCKFVKGDCTQVKTRIKTGSVLRWLDAPGVWLPDDYTFYGNQMLIRASVRGFGLNKCECVIDFKQMARRVLNKNVVSQSIEYVSGDKCTVLSEPSIKNHYSQKITKKSIVYGKV